jgi:hypothetical protein
MQNYYTNMLKVCVLIVIPTPVLSFWYYATFTAAKWKPLWYMKNITFRHVVWTGRVHLYL